MSEATGLLKGIAPNSRRNLIYEPTEGSSTDRIRVYRWDGARISRNATSSRMEKE